MIHGEANVTWVQDCLPHLHSLLSRHGKFKFILCHAVWQYLDEGERVQAIERVASLLEPEGVFALALRHGPAGSGTHYFTASAERTIEVAQSHGLEVALRLDNQPSHVPGKTGVTWTRLAFTKPSVSETSAKPFQ